MPARTSATHRLVVEQDADDDDDDDPEQGLDTDDDEEEPEDAGMSPNDGDDKDEDAEDDAEEEAQPVSQPPKRSAARASGTNKGKGKAAPPPPRQEPRKKRSAAPLVFACADYTPLWLWGGVNALQKQWCNLTLLWREYKCGDGGSGHGSVEKPPWYPYLELHNQDTAAAASHAVDAGGATDVNVPAGMEDMRLARERMTESAPPDVHRAPPDFSPPPPRGESAPPPEAAQHGDDVGYVNTVTPGAEDVEIWVRGADD
ncbi:unnamed protein product [Closterium sp. NIES-53]